jgi:hypothetical protein
MLKQQKVAQEWDYKILLKELSRLVAAIKFIPKLIKVLK